MELVEKDLSKRAIMAFGDHVEKGVQARGGKEAGGVY